MRRKMKAEIPVAHLTKWGQPRMPVTSILWNKTEAEFKREVVTRAGYLFRGFIEFRGRKQPTWEAIPKVGFDPKEWEIISRKRWLELTMPGDSDEN